MGHASSPGRCRRLRLNSRPYPTRLLCNMFQPVPLCLSKAATQNTPSVQTPPGDRFVPLKRQANNSIMGETLSVSHLDKYMGRNIENLSSGINSIIALSELHHFTRHAWPTIVYLSRPMRRMYRNVYYPCKVRGKEDFISCFIRHSTYHHAEYAVRHDSNNSGRFSVCPFAVLFTNLMSTSVQVPLFLGMCVLE